MNDPYPARSLIIKRLSLDNSFAGFQQVLVLHQYDLGTGWYGRFDIGVVIDATKHNDHSG